MQTAVFAGGCFWGVEAVFEHVKGVTDAKSGYAGGDAKSGELRRGERRRHDHAESVKVTFDPTKVTYVQLLTVFFSVAHDPTELNRQGPDVGPQYRSAIFYMNDEQKKLAEDYIDAIRQIKGLAKTDRHAGRRRSTNSTTPRSITRTTWSRNPKQPYIVDHDLPKLEA